MDKPHYDALSEVYINLCLEILWLKMFFTFMILLTIHHVVPFEYVA